MILGLSISTFTSVHVALSLIGIVSGVIVLHGMVRATRLDGWTALFLATTVLTSVTAFFFPSTSFRPAHAIGVLSLVVLAAAIVAVYFFRLAGPWRWIYIVGAVLALYLNVFVAVVPAFQKLRPLAAFEVMAARRSCREIGVRTIGWEKPQNSYAAWALLPFTEGR
jgi:hypothetical protein